MVSLLLGALVLGAAPAGAATGPYLVKNINSSGDSEPRDLTPMGGKLYFTAKGGAKGRELWTSDGTSAGTFRIKDIKPGPGGSYPTDLTVMGGLLYFAADDGVNGYQLWATDGTRSRHEARQTHPVGRGWGV